MPRPGPVRSTARRWLRGPRGSVLIVALLLMVVLALGLATYLQLNLGSARLAQRTHWQSAAFHLAEAGAEEALWSLNRAAASLPDAWTNWTLVGTGARRRFEGFDLGGNTRADVQVHLSHVTTEAPRPRVLALATVQAPGDVPVTRLLEITLGRRSRHAMGLVAREAIAFAGTNTSVDSWDSDPDRNPATPPVPYEFARRNDGGSIASAAVSSTAVLLNHAAIWGRVATGGAAPQVGVYGSIRGRDTPAGVRIDPARVTTDFTADFPLLTAPVDGTPLAALGDTLGTPGTATKWRTEAIMLGGNQTLTILGDVTLVLTAPPGFDAISVTGSAAIDIPPGSSLTVYTEGEVRVAGRGLGNTNAQPATFQLIGVSASPSAQNVHLAGNGALKATVYAPNAHVRMNGNGDMMGAVVARAITLTGNAAFHYDEALARQGDGMPFGLVRWREIDDGAERAALAGMFAGW